MSDGLPTGEQLRRIERGVQRRIDARRRVAQRVVGVSVAVVLVAGGIALVRPLLPMVASGTSAASGSGSTASRTVAVTCHRGATTTRVRAARAGLPASAIAACSSGMRAATAGGAPNALQDGSASPSPSPSAVLCAAPSGALHVYLGNAGTCTADGMAPVPPRH